MLIKAPNTYIKNKKKQGENGMKATTGNVGLEQSKPKDRLFLVLLSKLVPWLDEITVARLNTVLKVGVPQLGLYLLPTFAIFAIGYDQGQIEALIGMGTPANSFLHEAFHDLRHVAGFMCH